jgi:hypothetical protein
MQQKTMPDNEIDKIKRTLDEERMKKIQVNVFIVTVLKLRFMSSDFFYNQKLWQFFSLLKHTNKYTLY